MNALFAIVIPPLSKAPSQRTDRDFQLVSIVLYLIRNLAFVKDLRQSANLSANQLEFTSLQSALLGSSLQLTSSNSSSPLLRTPKMILG